MTKYFCDRCGKQIQRLEHVCSVFFEEKGAFSDHVEVCYDCLKRIKLVAKRKDAPAEDE